LDYQIKLRDKYLRNFYYIFKKVDDDNNGIIDEEEFIKLLLLMDTYPQEYIDDVSKSLLNEIDPFNNKQITFSQCVNLFSNQFSIDGEQNKVKINILDKISINENILKNRN
jgi:Ca2+-binding EF-hand superfamily protein